VAKAKPRDYFYSAIKELTGFSVPPLYQRILEENAIVIRSQQFKRIEMGQYGLVLLKASVATMGKLFRLIHSLWE